MSHWFPFGMPYQTRLFLREGVCYGGGWVDLPRYLSCNVFSRILHPKDSRVTTSIFSWNTTGPSTSHRSRKMNRSGELGSQNGWGVRGMIFPSMDLYIYRYIYNIYMVSIVQNILVPYVRKRYFPMYFFQHQPIHGSTNIIWKSYENDWTGSHWSLNEGWFMTCCLVRIIPRLPVIPCEDRCFSSIHPPTEARPAFLGVPNFQGMSGRYPPEI